MLLVQARAWGCMTPRNFTGSQEQCGLFVILLGFRWACIGVQVGLCWDPGVQVSVC